MPLPLTVSCFSKIQTGFIFLVPAQLGSPGQRAVKRACVCYCSLYINSGAYMYDSGRLVRDALQQFSSWINRYRVDDVLYTRYRARHCIVHAALRTPPYTIMHRCNNDKQSPHMSEYPTKILTVNSSWVSPDTKFLFDGITVFMSQPFRVILGTRKKHLILSFYSKTTHLFVFLFVLLYNCLMFFGCLYGE